METPDINPERILISKMIEASEEKDYLNIEDEIQAVRNDPAHIILIESMKEYARQAVTYALEQAAENALTEEHPADYYKAPEMKREIVDKSSILSLKEQILKELGI